MLTSSRGDEKDERKLMKLSTVAWASWTGSGRMEAMLIERDLHSLVCWPNADAGMPTCAVSDCKARRVIVCVRMSR